MNRHLIILAASLLLHTSSTQAQETAEHGGEEHSEAEAVTETDEASDSDEEEEEGDGPFFGVRMPVRDATLPQGTLALQWDLGLERSEADTTSDYFNLGIGYGVIDRLEVGATLTPLALGLFDTDFDYLDPSLYARYLIVRGDRELSFTVSGSIPTGEQDSEVGLALIGAIEIDDIVLEYGLEMEMELGDEVEVGLEIPAEVYYSFSDQLYVMLATGFVTENLKEVSSEWALPLESIVGMSFGDERPVFDLSMGLTFPNFVNGDGVEAETWMLELAGRAYFWL